MKTIILYGSLGLRSGPIAEELSKTVDPKVFHLEGGIFKWANDGGALVAAPGVPVGQVHPNNSVWGRLLAPDKRAKVASGVSEKSSP